MLFGFILVYIVLNLTALVAVRFSHSNAVQMILG